MNAMPFGRHRGVPLDELPVDYLEWLLTRDLRDPLKSAAQAEWVRRERLKERNGNGNGHQHQREEKREPPPPPPPPAPPSMKATLKEIVDVGYRRLALKAHPHMGGNNADMVRLNQARDWLRKYVA
jgi:Putative quorum-sensing-regulated virulence factor